MLLSHWVMSDSLWPHGLQPTRLLCPLDFPGKNTGVGHHFLLQGIFPTQEPNPSLFNLLLWQTNSFTTVLPGKPNLGCTSVQFSLSVLSDSLRPHGLQHTRLPCLSSTPGAYSNSCPSSWWYHPTNSSSVVISSCLQSLPALRSFLMNQFFLSGGQCWSFSFSISPSNEYSGLISFRIDWFYLLVVQITLKNLLQHDCSKASILQRSAFFMVQLSHPYMTTGKTIALT